MNSVLLSATLAALFFHHFGVSTWMGLAILIVLGLAAIFRDKKGIIIGLIVLCVALNFKYHYQFLPPVPGQNYRVAVSTPHHQWCKIQKINQKVPIHTLFLKNSTTYQPLKGDLSVDTISKKGSVYYINGTLSNIVSKPSKIRDYLSYKVGQLGRGNVNLNGFLQASLLGKKEALPEQFYLEMKQVNALHLMVVSGLHVAIVLALIVGLLSVIGLEHRTKYIIALGVLTGYVCIVSYSVSIERAYIMGVIYLLSKIFYLGYDAKKSLKIAYITSLLIAPADIYSVSFQLSYTALFVLIYLFPYIQRKTSHVVIQFVVLTVGIQLFLQPLFLAYFKVFNPIGLISNILLIPYGVVIITLGFIGFFLSILIFPVAIIFNKILLVLFKGFEFYIAIFYHNLSIPLLWPSWIGNTLLGMLFIFIFSFIWYNDYREDV